MTIDRIQQKLDWLLTQMAEIKKDIHEIAVKLTEKPKE